MNRISRTRADRDGLLWDVAHLLVSESSPERVLEAVGDALALSVMRERNFTADDFALYHPAGQLGRKLMRVHEAMTFRAGETLPLAQEDHTVGEILPDLRPRQDHRAAEAALADFPNAKSVTREEFDSSGEGPR